MRWQRIVSASLKVRIFISAAVAAAVFLHSSNTVLSAGPTATPESTIAVYCNPLGSKPDLAEELDLAGGGLIAKCSRSGGRSGGRSTGGSGSRGGGSFHGGGFQGVSFGGFRGFPGVIDTTDYQLSRVERELTAAAQAMDKSDFGSDDSGRRSTQTIQPVKRNPVNNPVVVKPDPAVLPKPKTSTLLDASSGMNKVASLPSGQQLGQTGTIQATPAPTAGAGLQTSGTHSKHDDRDASQLLQSSPGMKQIASAPKTLYQKEDPKDKEIIDAFADQIGDAIQQAEIKAGLTPINPSSGGSGTNQGTTASGKQTASTGPGKQTVSTGTGKDKATEQAIKDYQDKYKKLSDEWSKTMGELKELGSPYLGINPGKRAELEEKLRNLQSQMNALPYPGGANGPAPISGVPGSGQGPTGPGSSQATAGPGKDNKTTSPGNRTTSSGSGTGKDKLGSNSGGPIPGQQGPYYDPATDTIGIYQADKDGNFTKVRDLEVGEEFVDSDGDRRIYDGAGGGRLVEDWNKQKATNEKYDSDRLSDARDQGTAPSPFFEDIVNKQKEAQDLLDALTKLDKFIRNAPPGVSPSLRDFVDRQIPDYNTASRDSKNVQKVTHAVTNVVQGEREREGATQEEKDAFWSEALHDAELAKTAGKLAGSILIGRGIDAAAGALAELATAERLAAAVKAERDAARAGEALKAVKEARDLAERRDLVRRALEVKEIGRRPEVQDLFHPKNSQHLDYLLHR
jgi:hypothetical protein